MSMRLRSGRVRLTDQGLWGDEVIAVSGVEVRHAFSSELKVLLLVMTNRDMCCSRGY